MESYLFVMSGNLKKQHSKSSHSFDRDGRFCHLGPMNAKARSPRRSKIKEINLQFRRILDALVKHLVRPNGRCDITTRPGWRSLEPAIHL
ncbi:hypothetical protein ASD02_16530 [Ensifer sp. Root1252]|nr:hypothetical protein ASD02_16530 [Ensifer sp. Root1252]KQY76925.1 hypothetical protein ASD52_23265 [Ensifer sp. Root142]KRC57161.1 hypothetical protein ASE32_19845 [Ensifer sp. Root231]KRC87656.1 hypothetical protein ASE47_14000 [Ensifer sp. Root258]